MKKIIKKILPTSISALVYIKESNSLNEYQDSLYKLIVYSFPSGIKKIDKRKFHKVYVVYDDNKIIHMSYVFKNNLLSRQLGFKNYFTIGDCVTLPEYRGKGIYPNVLKKIVADFSTENLVMFVNKTNLSSIKGIEKGGFKLAFHFKMLRILGLNIKTRKFNNAS